MAGDPHESGGGPREYVHQTCGTATTMPPDVVRQYLADPWHYLSDRTFCVGCNANVPDRECAWDDTGENLQEYFNRLRAVKPPGPAVMSFVLAVKLGLALVVIFGMGGALIYAGVAGKKGPVTFDDVYPGVAAICAGLGVVGLLYFMSRPPAPE